MLTDNLDLDEFQEEMNQEVKEAEEQTELDDDEILFDENGDVEEPEEKEELKDDLFDDEPTERPILETNDVTTFFDAINGMIAGMMSEITGKSLARYTVNKTQSKAVASAYVKAFPTMTASPKTTLIFIVLLTYLPLATKVFKDIKEVKNERSTNDNIIRNEWNRQNNLSEQNNREHQEGKKIDFNSRPDGMDRNSGDKKE